MAGGRQGVWTGETGKGRGTERLAARVSVNAATLFSVCFRLLVTVQLGSSGFDWRHWAVFRAEGDQERQHA